MKHSNSQIVAAYRQAYLESMDRTAAELLELGYKNEQSNAAVVARSIVAPKDDTGDNAPESLAVIYAESGLPLSYYDSAEAPMRYDARANEILGLDGAVFTEWHNAAVLAVYWA